MIICMLTVGDDKLTVGDNNNVLLEVARGRACAKVPRQLM